MRKLGETPGSYRRRGTTVQSAGGSGIAISAALDEVKIQLANAMYERIFPCGKLFIGTGTTCLARAKTIARRNSFCNTIITHSLSVAAALFQSPSQVILLGGELRTNAMELVGKVAEKKIWKNTGWNG